MNSAAFATSAGSASPLRPPRAKRAALGRKRDPFTLGPEEVASALEIRMLSAHEYLISKLIIPALDQVEKHVIPAAFGCDVEVTASGDHVLLSASQGLDYIQLEQRGAAVQRLAACEQCAVDLRGMLFFLPPPGTDEDVLDFCLLVARRAEIKEIVARHFTEASGGQRTSIPLRVALFCARQREFILENVLSAPGESVRPEPALVSPRQKFVKFVQKTDYGEEISLSGSQTEKEADGLCSESC